VELVRGIVHDYIVLFGMVNAVGNLPVFATYIGSLERPEVHRTIRTAVSVACGIVVAFALFGDAMLTYLFEIDTASFKIAGGIVVFAVAARGVLGGAHHSLTADPAPDPSVFPLGFPFLAGPGTIVTSILLLQSSGSLATVVATLLVYATVIPVLYLAPLVERTVGRISVLVVARILYIFICAKAVAFILDGVRTLLPGLA